MSIEIENLSAHAADVSADSSLTGADFIAVSETCQEDGAAVEITGFDCIGQAMRDSVSVG